MVEVVGLFSYFNYFPHYVGMVGAAVGSLEVVAMFSH
jgi:hypothetical protein